MRLRDTQHIGGRDRAYPVAIGIKVVTRQPKNLDVGQSTRDFCGRLKADGKDANQIARGQRQFGVAHGGFANPRELNLDFTQRVDRDRGFHRSGYLERTGGATPVECGVCAVGVRVHFAQVEIQAGRKQTAKNRVHHHEREIVGMQSRHRDMANPHFRLRRVRFRDQMDARRAVSLIIHRLRHGRCAADPVAECPRRVRDGVVDRNVTDDDQRGRVRSIVARVILHHAIASDARHALFVTAGQSRKSRFRGIEQAREIHIGQSARFRAQLRQISQSFGAQTRQFAVRKRGVAQHFGEHGERVVNARRQRCQLHNRGIPISARVERGAERLQALGQLQRIHVPGAFGQRARRQLREPFGIARIPRRASLNHGEHRHHRIRTHG